MASLWRHRRSLFIKDLGNKLIFFRFYHQHDLRWVMDSRPWTSDNHLLVLHKLKSNEEPTDVPFHLAAFWVQIYDLPICFFSDVVGKALGNFIGSFLAYD